MVLGEPLVPTGECAVDRFNRTKPARETSLNCTSNDVRIAELIKLSDLTSCVEGEPVNLQLTARIVATSSERWDVGLFVATDGLDPNLVSSEPGASQSCYNDDLHPVSVDNTDLDVASGFGPFYNGEVGVLAADGTSDLCGDIQQGVDNYSVLEPFTFICQDSDGDGYADVPTCTVWANQATTKNDETSCQDASDTTAETTAKCTCEQVHIDLLIAGTIQVTKVLEPALDPGKFDLLVDGLVEADDVGDDGTTAVVKVEPAMEHTVGEAAGTGTSLPSYTSAISCTSDHGHSAGVDGAGSLSLFVESGEDWACTVTNIRKPHLSLVKVVSNDNGGAALPTDWMLGAVGPTPISGAGAAESDVLPGTYALEESVGPAGYSAGAWSCTGGVQVGASLTLGPGDVAVCSITNDDLAPSLTLVKQVVNDNGGTALPTAWTLVAAGPTPLAGTTPVASDASFRAGVYALSEAGPAGYAASAWSCAGGVQDAASITLGLGEQAVCTITNDDRPPSLELVKEPVNRYGGTAAATDWTVSAAGPTPISGAGTAESGPSFARGTYTLGESAGPAGYVAGAWSCVGDGAFAGGAITLELGEAAICTIHNLDQPGHVDVVKTVLGVPPSGTEDFTFELRQGASPTAIGSVLETGHAGAAGGGVIHFAFALSVGTTYQLCEVVMPGWSTSLGTFVPGAFMPPDGVVPDPSVDNSILCVDFTVALDETRSFAVDNAPPPGGRALTIGFWKNWASCAGSNGKGHEPVLDETLAATEPDGIVVAASSGVYPEFGEVYALVLHGDDCALAVSLLNKSSFESGKKMASDPAFGLAAQLVAAELNYAAGAGKTGEATAAITESVLLLGKVHFDGSHHTTISRADAAEMRALSTVLDDYNNDR